MNLSSRKLLLGSLLVAFAFQTSLVYLDDTADAPEQPVLTGKAMQGRQIWHAYNCQTCHQIYGFGGFLGPDLTNAMSRITRERLDSILTVGYGQMEAFHFQPEQIDAIEAYLRALNETGIGQARKGKPVDKERISKKIDDPVASENPMSEAAQRGRKIFESPFRCVSCHTLFRATPIGPNLAPDLSNVVERLSDRKIHETLADGRPLKGMPAQGLKKEQQDEVIAFFKWVAENRTILIHTLDIREGDESLPFFDFR